MNIDWTDSSSSLLYNPVNWESDKNRLAQLRCFVNNLQSHFCLSTSGSQSPKWVLLSKQAVLASAEAVNKHIQVNENECWIQALPSFHVGGLGIWARAYLTESSVYDFRSENGNRWSAELFYNYVKEKRGTLTSLVPAQLHDLIALNRKAPSTLRAVIIGGGALSKELYEQGLQLGWPLLPSYGLTECASQVATARLNRDSALRLLPHIEMKEENAKLWIKSPALLTSYVIEREGRWVLEDPKEKGWFALEDHGSLQGDVLTIYGRIDNRIKIGGESVHMDVLEQKLQNLRLRLKIHEEMTLMDVADVRLGRVIYLATQKMSESVLQNLLELFNGEVLPFEKIRKVKFLDTLPRTELMKVNRRELRKKMETE